MFRKLVTVAVATIATMSFLTTAAVPASADDPSTLTITIQYDGSSLPNTGGGYTLNGNGLVGSITGAIDGEVVDATSCAVDVTSLDAFLAGSSAAVVGNCGDASSIAAQLTPSVDPDGGVLADGDVSSAILEWEVRGKCRGRWLFGIPVWVECEVSVSVSNN